MYIKLKIDVFWPNNNSLPIRPPRTLPEWDPLRNKIRKYPPVQDSEQWLTGRWYKSLEVWPKSVDTLLTKVPVVQTLDSDIQRISIRERPIALSTG